MNILIMNGNPEPSGFDERLARIAADSSALGHVARTVVLRDSGVKSCTGCWSCWWATPGRCIHADGMAGLYPGILSADLLVWASPLVMGNVSAITRAAQERMIPLLHPYIELVRGECHHRRRYARMPEFGLVLDPGPGDGPEDFGIVASQHDRFALNARTRVRFVSCIGDMTGEAIHAALAS